MSGVGMRTLRARTAPAGAAHLHDAASAVTALEVEDSHAVLDLGCGDGYHQRLVDAGPAGRVVALDLDLRGLSGVRREPGPLPGRRLFVRADALALPFAARTFDRVICSLVLYLLPIGRALDELHRILKVGGRAYVRVPMLSLGRSWKALTIPPGIHGKAYSLAHVGNGIVFGLFGMQVRNRLLRHDSWACYVPRTRFIAAVRKAGFRIDRLDIDVPRPGLASIDAWITRT